MFEHIKTWKVGYGIVGEKNRNPKSYMQNNCCSQTKQK